MRCSQAATRDRLDAFSLKPFDLFDPVKNPAGNLYKGRTAPGPALAFQRARGQVPALGKLGLSKKRGLHLASPSASLMDKECRIQAQLA